MDIVCFDNTHLTDLFYTIDFLGAGADAKGKLV